jgi:hypothetical protein
MLDNTMDITDQKEHGSNELASIECAMLTMVLLNCLVTPLTLEERLVWVGAGCHGD